ncbi:hypothetical protein, partial [Burkholderia cenocepacia]|uniref:hypothetical protein n=1 Tax=Burkholderia cenocepacia TaxID=95486 RepID=UPI0038CC186C
MTSGPTERLDRSLLPADLRARCIRESWMPTGRVGDEIVVAAAAPTRALARDLEAALGHPVRLVPTPRQRIVDEVLAAFGPEFASSAADALHDRDPDRSGRTVFT